MRKDDKREEKEETTTVAGEVVDEWVGHEWLVLGHWQSKEGREMREGNQKWNWGKSYREGFHGVPKLGKFILAWRPRDHR